MSTLLIKLIEGEISGKKAKQKVSKSLNQYFNTLPSKKKTDIGIKARCARLLKQRLLEAIEEIEQMKNNSA